MVLPSSVVAVQSLSHVQLFATPWTIACQVSLPLMISQSLLKFMSVESVMPSEHLIFCHPLLLLPSIFPSIRAFSSDQLYKVNMRRLIGKDPDAGKGWGQEEKQAAEDEMVGWHH